MYTALSIVFCPFRFRLLTWQVNLAANFCLYLSSACKFTDMAMLLSRPIISYSLELHSQHGCKITQTIFLEFLISPSFSTKVCSDHLSMFAIVWWTLNGIDSSTQNPTPLCFFFCVFYCNLYPESHILQQIFVFLIMNSIQIKHLG